MDIKEKIVNALRTLKPAYVRIEDEDGISGFVVAPSFVGISSLDRQKRIEKALNEAPLSKGERRRVLMMAGLTPAEYDAVGARIRIHHVKETSGPAIEVLLHGGPSDAEYVRGALNNQKGVRTTAPKSVRGALGELMSFRAKGTNATPLTREWAIRVLKNDPYIEVMSNA